MGDSLKRCRRSAKRRQRVEDGAEWPDEHAVLQAATAQVAAHGGQIPAGRVHLDSGNRAADPHVSYLRAAAKGCERFVPECLHLSRRRVGGRRQHCPVGRGHCAGEWMSGERVAMEEDATTVGCRHQPLPCRHAGRVVIEHCPLAGRPGVLLRQRQHGRGGRAEDGLPVLVPPGGASADVVRGLRGRLPRR